jgi:hypothetical protein
MKQLVTDVKPDKSQQHESPGAVSQGRRTTGQTGGLRDKRAHELSN